MICRAKSMVSSLVSAVLGIGKEQQWVIEEDLFGLGLANSMFIITLSSIACIPVKTANLTPVDHILYIITIYRWSKCLGHKILYPDGNEP